VDLLNEIKLIKYNNNKNDKLLELEDLVEYREVTYQEDLQDIIDSLIEIAIYEEDAEIQANALSLAVSLLTYGNKKIKLNLDKLINNINSIDDISIESVICIIGFSNNDKYLGILKKFKGIKNVDRAVDDAINELNYSIKIDSK